MTLSVSIVIPVRNEATCIRACLDSWLQQTVDVEEIVVIDSGSTDGTVEILKGYDRVKLVEIDGSDFNHGTTRNLAMQHVTGDLTLMTVGDARAVDDRVLETLRNGFDSDEVAGVCGSQVVPHEPDKNPVEWFRPQSDAQTVSYSFTTAEDFERLSPDEKRQAAAWDDVLALYRTRVLRDEIPFREITYGEDPMWAIDALRAGHRLVYAQSARVYHYHLEDEAVAYRRAITMLCLRHRLFGHVPDDDPALMRPMLSAARVLVSESGLGLRDRARWMSHNLAQRRALRRAFRDFREALASGEAALTELHDRCAGKPFKVAG